MDEVKLECPRCGEMAAISQYGGERGEAGPFIYCYACDYDEEPFQKIASTTAWTVKDSKGNLSIYHVSSSKKNVEKTIVSSYYSPAGLTEDVSYRKLFEEEVVEGIKQSGYTIIKIRIYEIKE